MRQFAGVLLLTLAATGCSTSSTPEATPSPSPTYVVGTAAARCARPLPADLADATTAFEGTVIQIGDGVATLRVTRTFAGQPAEQVQLSTRNEHADTLSGSGAFATGRAYLITVTDGDVNDCLSGPVDYTALQESYAAAFGTGCDPMKGSTPGRT